MRQIFFIAVCIFLSFIGYSQSKSSFPYLSKPEQGFLIDFSGDTLFGEIVLKKLPKHIGVKEDGQKKVVYYYVGELQKAKAGSHLFVPVNYSSNLKAGGVKKSMLEVLDTGYIKVYRFFDLGTNSSTSNGVSKQNSFTTYVVIHKPKQKAIGMNDSKFVRFSQGIQKYVIECDTLVDKIEAKETGYKKKSDIENIVKEYNDWKDSSLATIKKEQEVKEEQEKEKIRKELELELREELEEEIRREYEEKEKKGVE